MLSASFPQHACGRVSRSRDESVLPTDLLATIRIDNRSWRLVKCRAACACVAGIATRDCRPVAAFRAVGTRALVQGSVSTRATDRAVRRALQANGSW